MLKEFLIENKKRVVILVVVVILLFTIAKVIWKDKEAVNSNSAASPGKGFNADYDPRFDDPYADQYQVDFERSEDVLVPEVDNF